MVKHFQILLYTPCGCPLVLEILSSENFQELKPEYLVKWKVQPVDGEYSYYEIGLSVCCFGLILLFPDNWYHFTLWWHDNFGGTTIVWVNNKTQKCLETMYAFFNSFDLLFFRLGVWYWWYITPRSWMFSVNCFWRAWAYQSALSSQEHQAIRPFQKLLMNCRFVIYFWTLAQPIRDIRMVSTSV